MQESLEETRKQFARLMREERQAYERLNDLVRKYRTIFPFLSERSRSLEERLDMLMENRDQSKSLLASLRSKQRFVQMKLRHADEALENARAGRDRLLSQYNDMLKGKLPSAPELENLTLPEKKGKFMESLERKFAGIERQVDTLNGEMAELGIRRKKLAEKSGRLGVKAGIAETKLALYQNDIRDVILEINNVAANERKLTEEYRELVKLIKNAPDIGAWGRTVFAEAVSKTAASSGGILELHTPIANRVGLH